VPANDGDGSFGGRIFGYFRHQELAAETWQLVVHIL
jgi:hypothetical protein